MQLPSGIAADIDVTKIFAALQGGTLKSIAATAFRPAYYIRLSGEETIALKVDGIVNLKSTGNATITKSPIEGGTYQSINKVRQPNILVASVIINNFGLANFDWRLLDNFTNWVTNSGVKPTETLSRIKVMIESTQLYDIETPKETFGGYDLVNYTYQVTHNTGVSMLTVQLTFEEILQVMEVSLSGGVSQKAGTTSIDDNKASTALSALEKKRGGILKKISDGVSGTLEEAWKALDKFGNDINSARDAIIKTIKENIL